VTDSEAASVAMTLDGAPEESRSDDVAPNRAGDALRDFLTRYGLLVGLVALIAIFGYMRPDSFFTIANARTTASLAAPLLVLAIGLTVPLGMGEFDLAIANSAQLSAAIMISLISTSGVFWLSAIGITALIAAGIGVIIGVIVVKSRVNAFIVTLGAGTILLGLEFGVARGGTIYSDIPSAYGELSSGRVFGVPNAVLIAFAFALIVWVGMERTVVGRKMRAIGGSMEAARLSGVRVGLLRGSGFVVTGLSGVIAAVLLTSQAASYYPGSAASLLLTVYAACFLGTTVLRSNVFDVGGTIVGVAFLAVIESGLIMLGIESWIAQIVKGCLLIGAVTASKVAGRVA
jgi:ribose transport system permease protein